MSLGHDALSLSARRLPSVGGSQLISTKAAEMLKCSKIAASRPWVAATLPHGGTRRERNTGHPGQLEERSHRGLRQRPDTDSKSGRARQGEPALHPGLPRVVADPLRPQGDPHGHEDLALQELRQAARRNLPAGRLAADPRGSDYSVRDPVRVGLQHGHVRRYPAPFPPLYELPARFRGVRVAPWPGEGSLPPQSRSSPGADQAEDGPWQ